MSIFTEADVDNSGGLDIDEFRAVVVRYTNLYPQLMEYSKRINNLFQEYDTNRDNKLSSAEFRQFLMMADSQIKSLPATAQVASQEGIYLANIFNSVAAKKTPEADLAPFIYHHMGQLAYVGDFEAVGNIIGRDTCGFGTWWLWRGAYLSRQVSIRNQWLLMFDWSKAFIFGRDCSRF